MARAVRDHRPVGLSPLFVGDQPVARDPLSHRGDALDQPVGPVDHALAEPLLPVPLKGCPGFISGDDLAVVVDLGALSLGAGPAHGALFPLAEPFLPVPFGLALEKLLELFPAGQIPQLSAALLGLQAYLLPCLFICLILIRLFSVFVGRTIHKCLSRQAPYRSPLWTSASFSAKQEQRVPSSSSPM